MSKSAQFRTHCSPSGTRCCFDCFGVVCLVLGVDWCSVSSVRAWVSCIAWSALHLARPALLPVLFSRSGCTGGWGLHLWGIWGEPGVGVVDTSRRKNSKKAFSMPTHPIFSAKNTQHPPLPISKISRKNKKTPTNGLCYVLYLPYKP